MCRDGACMPTTTQKVLGRLLHDLADALAREMDADPRDVTIGPVDLGPEKATA